MSKDYDNIIDILANGTQEQLEELSEMLDEFPDGRDNFIFKHWIINAIDCGTKLSLNFSLTGIISGISSVLASSSISIFAISTFNTDYILVKSSELKEAVRVLRGAGYMVIE